MTDVSILAQVRGLVRQYFTASQASIQPMLGDGGELLINQTLPERSELVRLGKSWGAAIPTGSAFTPAAAWPTAACNLTMYNGEAPGGPSYVIDRVWATMITGGMTGPMALLGQIVPVGAVAAGLAGATGSFTDASTVLKWQLSGRLSAYAGNAKFVVSSGNAGVTNKWFQLGPSSPLVTANAGGVVVGLGVEANLFGRIIVPPGAYFNLMNASGQATGTGIAGIDWHEIQLSLA